MTININELRRKVNSTDAVDHIDLHANIKPFLSELLDRIEAAEKERDAAELMSLALRAKLEAAEKERDDAKAAAENIALKLDYLRSKLETAENAQNDWLRANAPGGWIDNLRIENEALRAKIAEMERQKPVGTLHDDGYFTWSCPRPHESNYAGWKMALYALPSAKEQEPTRDWWDCLIANISAIDCMCRGSPTYEHEAYWMREHVVRMLEQRRDASPLHKEPLMWQPIETAPKDNKRPVFLARFNDDGTLQSFDYDGSWESESESWEMPLVYYFWASANGNVEEPSHWMYQPEWFDRVSPAQGEEK